MASRREEAVQIINRAIDLGINYIDTSAIYGGGGSETNIGYVMKERRNEVFLATKSQDYTYDGTMRLFEQSLRRLQTDHLDLYQHHFLNSRTLQQLRGGNSARTAFEKLRNDGVIRFLGVTAHSSKVLADALEDYPYDCALITLNAAREVMDEPSDLDRFFRIAQEKQVGVIAMKVVARGDLINRGFNIRQLLPYALSYPVSTAVIGISNIRVLEENVRVAQEFRPMGEQEMRNLEAQTRR
jgi:aryl-alcohol dehydrogenase-like predicted oxidoreductase